MRRLIIQVIFFFAQNPFIANVFRGRIYDGRAKHACTPGLNCYSCPAAAFSCPVGAMQMFLGGVRHNISMLVAGLVITSGAIFGRLICGYVCPFGLFQDLLWRIKTPLKTPKRRLRLRFLRYVKYVVLVVFVIVLPLAIRSELSGLGQPWFCKVICPSGTVFAAVPLLAAHESLRNFLGVLFWLKATIAFAVIVGSVFVYRPFCRILCPLGAFYGLFNGFSLFGLRCDKEKCVSCGKCEQVCDSAVDPVNSPNSPECIRCGDCVKSCGAKALRISARG